MSYFNDCYYNCQNLVALYEIHEGGMGGEK